MSNDTTPRIYVACLACYNAGKLKGEWIDADQDADAVHAEIQKMLANCGHEEAAIHDHEGFQGIQADKLSIEQVANAAAAIDEHGEAFIAAFLNDPYSGVEEAKQTVEENYLGCHDSLEDWAEEYLTDSGALADAPKLLTQYFDFKAYAHDCEQGGDVWTHQGEDGLHIFSNR